MDPSVAQQCARTRDAFVEVHVDGIQSASAKGGDARGGPDDAVDLGIFRRRCDGDSPPQVSASDD